MTGSPAGLTGLQRAQLMSTWGLPRGYLRVNTQMRESRAKMDGYRHSVADGNFEQKVETDVTLFVRHDEFATILGLSVTSLLGHQASTFRSFFPYFSEMSPLRRSSLARWNEWATAAQGGGLRAPACFRLHMPRIRVCVPIRPARRLLQRCRQFGRSQVREALRHSGKQQLLRRLHAHQARGHCSAWCRTCRFPFPT